MTIETTNAENGHSTTTLMDHLTAATVMGLAAVARGTTQAGQTIKNFATLAVEGQAAEQIVTQVLQTLSDPNLREQVRQMGEAIARDILEDAVFDPRLAADPARRLLVALEGTERQSEELIKRLRRDHRWSIKNLWTLPRDRRVEVSEVVTELQRLSDSMWFRMLQCRLVGNRVLMKYHSLEQLVIAPYANEAPRLADDRLLFPIPPKEYYSEREKVVDLRGRLERLAIHLYRYASVTRVLVKDAETNGGATFTPDVVWSNAATFVSKALGVKATCAELAARANQEVKP